MRKILLPILVITIIMLCAVCSAEDITAGITAVLSDAGLNNPIQLQTWGDTAVCFIEQNGTKNLIVLENKSGRWEITVNNPTALIQNADWPELNVDSDNAIFWTYHLSDQEILRYHSTKNADGIWGSVDQYYADSGYGDYTHAWSTLWDEAHGGEIIRSFAISDENDNTSDGYIIQYLPGTWLGTSIKLADFDLTRFPTLVDPKYGAWFETDRFFQDAAATFMPDCTYIKGLLKDGALHFLVQKPTGAKVYVICEYASSRKANLIESTPLPADTRLGVENFTDCLWINQCSVAIHLLSDQKTMSIEYIYDDAVNGTDGGFLFFGDRVVWSDAEEQMILYGDHPWNDITQIDWNTLPRNLDEAAAQMDSSRYAMVVNPNPADRLHLREQADRGSRSQGKYYTGTPVTIRGNNGDWVHVLLGSTQSMRQGYMMKRYLVYGSSKGALRLDTSAMPQLLPRSEMLQVFEEPQMGKNTLHRGDSMKIIGIIGDEWYHVWFPASGEYGFVKQSDLWEGNG